MGDLLRAAPVLSTPDTHAFSEVEPASSTQRNVSDVSEATLRFRYEIDRTVRTIREQQWRRIALQFPDHMQTVTTLTNFVLIMLLFPEKQHAAQAEIDKVIGRSRLPDIEDKEALPYVTALVKEILR